MKLNLELVRDLLIYIEENGDGEQGVYDIRINGYTNNEIMYHTSLLAEIGYIDYYVTTQMGVGKSFIPTRLTIQGHMYIENIRNKYIWSELKKDMELKGIVNTSVDVIKDYANKFIRNKLGI